jgi:hypothetical protein
MREGFKIEGSTWQDLDEIDLLTARMLTPGLFQVEIFSYHVFWQYLKRDRTETRGDPKAIRAGADQAKKNQQLEECIQRPHLASPAAGL